MQSTHITTPRKTRRAALLRQLAEHHRAAASTIDALVAVELHEGADDEATVYGSAEPWPAPPHRSRRWLRENGPAMRAFGAERRGGKRGRGVVWLATVRALRAFEAARGTTAATEASCLTVVGDDALDRAIADSGYRATRVAR
jgi:hypothetical protein